MIAYANYTSSPKFITVVWAVEKNFLPPSQPCHTYMYGHVRQNMYAEDLRKLGPLFSFIKFNIDQYIGLFLYWGGIKKEAYVLV